MKVTTRLHAGLQCAAAEGGWCSFPILGTGEGTVCRRWCCWSLGDMRRPIPDWYEAPGSIRFAIWVDSRHSMRLHDGGINEALEQQVVRMSNCLYTSTSMISWLTIGISMILPMTRGTVYMPRIALLTAVAPLVTSRLSRS